MNRSGLHAVMVGMMSVVLSVAAAHGSEAWVDAKNGSDQNEGSRAKPFATLQKGIAAADGTARHTVHVLAGEYRELVKIDKSHVHVVVAEEDRGAAVLYASESSLGMKWAKADIAGLPEAAKGHVWAAAAGAWGGIDPKLAFIVRGDGTTMPLPIAREPDWEVTTPWKHHEHWWTVDMDGSNGSISSSQLGPLADLTGGRAWIKGMKQGHDTLGPVITRQDGNTIKLSFGVREYERKKDWTKFYVEGKVQLLDQEGEWCYDAASRKLYIWTPGDADPGKLHIEFAKRINALLIPGTRYKDDDIEDVVIDGLTVRGTSHNNDFYTSKSSAIAVEVDRPGEKMRDITIRNCLIEHNSRGIYVWDRDDSDSSKVTNLTIEDCEIGHSEGNAISSDSGRRKSAALVNTIVQRCHIHHAGFRNYPKEKDCPAVNLQFTDGLRFLNNEVHHTGHNGIQVDIRYRNCLVMGNYFWDCGLNGSDEGSIKFHAFHARDFKEPISTVVTKNVVRGNMGWGYGFTRVSWGDETGLMGAGIYFDHSSGGLIYRNLIVDAGYAGIWSANSRTDHNWIWNNTILDSRRGLEILENNVHSKVINNLIMNPSHRRLGFPPDLGDGQGFCGQLWLDVAPGESHHNAYRMTDGVVAIAYWDKASRKGHRLKTAAQIRGLGDGHGAGSLDLGGTDSSAVVKNVDALNAYPAEGSPVIDAGAPAPEELAAILKRVGLEPEKSVGKGRDIGANEYAAGGEKVVLTKPNGGEQVTAGTHLAIEWDASDFVGLVRIHLSRNGGKSWEVIKDGVPASWEQYRWKVPGGSAARALIKLTDYGNAEYDVSSRPFGIR